MVRHHLFFCSTFDPCTHFLVLSFGCWLRTTNRGYQAKVHLFFLILWASLRSIGAFLGASQEEIMLYRRHPKTEDEGRKCDILTALLFCIHWNLLHPGHSELVQNVEAFHYFPRPFANRQCCYNSPSFCVFL